MLEDVRLLGPDEEGGEGGVGVGGSRHAEKAGAVDIGEECVG